MTLHESAEDYLEKILMIQEKKGEVRSIDIAEALGYSKPSVSVAMKNLREAGYITMDGNNHITLEPSGYAVASRIYNRHRVLTHFLTAIGVSPEVAMKDACKMEHDLSDETFACMTAHLEKYGH